MGASVLAIAGIAASIGGSLIGMAGQQQGTDASRSQAHYNAAVARNSRLIAQQNARYAEQAGAVKEQAAGRRTAGVIGAQRAVAAAHGLDVNSGSPALLQEDAAALGHLDALTIRNNADREAYGYRSQATNFGAQEGLYQMEEDSLGGWASTAGSLIGGASGVADKWLTYDRAGIAPFASSTAAPIWV